MFILVAIKQYASALNLKSGEMALLFLASYICEFIARFLY
jgi:hypothetical protein